MTAPTIPTRKNRRSEWTYNSPCKQRGTRTSSRGNIRRDGRQDSGNNNEADPAGKIYNARLRQKQRDQGGLEQFSAEFDPEPSAKRERPAGCVIHENAGRICRNFFHHMFHRLVPLLSRCVLSDAGAGKM